MTNNDKIPCFNKCPIKFVCKIYEAYNNFRGELGKYYDLHDLEINFKCKIFLGLNKNNEQTSRKLSIGED